MEERKITPQESNTTLAGPDQKGDEETDDRIERDVEEKLKALFTGGDEDQDQEKVSRSSVNTARNKVIFVVEGEEYEADKETLSKQTDYFDVMLYGQYREAEQERIPLPGVSRTAFRRIMSFLHDGRILDEQNVLTFAKNDKKHLRPEAGYVDHIRDFWSNTLRLLDLADMYLISQPFKDYLHKTLANDQCRFKHSCVICNTAAMFCTVHTQYKLQVTMEYQTAVKWFQTAKEAGICEETKLYELVRNYELQYAVAERSFDLKEHGVVLKSHASDHPTSTSMIALSTIINESQFRVHVDRLILSSYSDDVDLARDELDTASTRFSANKLVYNAIADSRFSSPAFMIFLRMHQIQEVYLEFDEESDEIEGFKFHEECRQLGIPVRKSRWLRRARRRCQQTSTPFV